MLEILHTAFGFVSLATGLLVFTNRKGTRWHRQMGAAYMISMLGLNLTAFGIYRLFDGFGIFHWAALASLATIIPAFLVVRFRHRFKNWLSMHYQFMCWSFLGLLGATSNETFVHVPYANQLAQQFTWLPNLSVFLIFTLGGIVLFRREAAALKPFKRASQPGSPGIATPSPGV